MSLDAFNLASIRFGSVACAGAACLVGLCALLGFAMMLARGRGPGQSAKFAALLVVVPLACPAIFGAAFATSLYRTRAFLTSAVTTTGTVVRLAEDDSSDGGITYSAVVEFTTADGRVVEFEDSSRTCNPPCNQAGDEVPVLYSPDNPERAAIHSVYLDWAWPSTFGLLFVVFLGLALGLAWKSYRSGNWWGPAEAIVDVIGP